MADAFRGLTLRIGADARPVNSAIQSIKKSASAAQTQLTAMNKALRFNDNNTDALAAKLGLVEDKASLAAMASAKIGIAIRQAANRTVEFSKRVNLTGGTIAEVANNTTKIYTEVQRVNSAYNTTNAQLQRIYDNAARILQRKRNLENSDALALTISRLKQISHNEAIEYLNNLRKEMKGVGQSAEDAKKEYEEFFSKFSNSDAVEYIRMLREVQEGNSDAAEEARIELEKYIKQSAGLKAIWEGFDIIKNDGKAIIDVYHELQAAHKDYKSDLDVLKDVEGFKALKIQAIAFKSEVAELAAEAAKTRMAIAALGTNGRLASLLTDLKSVNAYSSLAADNARKISAAYTLLPNNTAMATAKIIAMAQAEEAARSELANIELALEKIRKDPAFDEQAARSKNAYIAAQRVESAYAEMTGQLKLAEEAADAFETQLKEVRSGNVKKTNADIEKMERELEQANSQVTHLRKQLDAMNESGEVELAGLVIQFHKLTAQAAEAATATRRLREETNLTAQTFGNIRTMGYGLYSTITPAIMMAARYAIQAADDVDAAYRNMRKTVQGTESDFEHLREAAIIFSRTHFTSADEILNIEAIGGQLGISVENLEKFAEVISNLDIATNLDTEDISANLGQLSNIMKDMDQDIQRGPGSFEAFSDALVRLGNNSATQEDRIMAVMMRVGSMGTIMGMTTDQLLALSTAVAASGQGSEAAGTAISRTFSNIENAVSKGGDKLAMFAKVSGMSARDFAKTWSESPMEAFVAFINGLHNIDEAGESVDGTLRELGINSVRQKQTLMNLTNQVDVLSDALIMSHDAWYGLGDEWGDAGDAAREAGRKAEGFSGQLQMLKNTAQGLGVVMLDGFVPMLKTASSILLSITEVLSGMHPWLKTIAAETTVLTALAGPAFIAVGALGNGITKIGRAIEHAQGWFMYRRILKEMGMDGMTAASMIDNLKLKVAELTNSERKLTEAETVAVASMKKQIGQFEEGAEKAKVFGSTFKALAATMAITIGIEAIIMLITAIVDANEKMKQFDRATRGLEDSMALFSKAASGTSDAVEATALSYESLRDAAKEAVDEAIQGNLDLSKSIGEAKASADATADSVRFYADKLESLNGTCAGNADQLALQRRYLEDFNNATGLSVEMVDEFTGALSMNNDEIETNIELLRKNTYANAIRDVAENSARDVAEYTVKLTELRNQLDALRSESIGGMLAGSGADAQFASGIDSQSAQVVESIRTIEKEIEKYERLIESAEKTSDAAFDEYEKAVMDTTTISGKLESETIQLAGAFDEFDEEAEDAADSIEAIQSSFDTLKSEFPALAKMLDDANIDAEGFQEMLDRLGLSMDDVSKSMEEMADSMSDGFNRIEENSEMSLEKYMDNLKHNREVTEKWGDNLKALYNKSSDETFQAWVREMAEAGPEYAKLIAEMTDKSEDELLKMAQAWQAARDAGPETYLDSIGMTSDEAIIDMQGIRGMLETLDGMKIKYTVSDDGTIKITEESLEGLDHIELAKKSIIVTDDGTIQEWFGEIEQITDQDGTVITYLASDDGTLTDLRGKALKFNEQLRIMQGKKTIEVIAVTNDAAIKLQGLAAQVDYLIRNKTINITAAVSTAIKGGNAKGGIVSAFKSGGVFPAHANGALNGIAVRPLLTNIGWVGEDGAEAILNMKNAGGAVVPLTNKRYVAPFAHAVASEMAPAYTGRLGGDVYSITIDGATINDNEAMRAATKDYLLEMRRLAAI